jgi:penicillin-binding protein 1C
MLRRLLRPLLIFFCLALIVLAAATWSAMRSFPPRLDFQESAVRKVQVVDRHATPLTVTYQNDWNLHDYLPLHQIPLPLQQIFVMAEDQRFYRHHGVDWLARLNATAQNLSAGQIVRGASTITEQATRILHPRPRTFWSRWVETFEAMQLEARFSKAEILEFYLNQVPYANQRRGLLQASRYYFDRDLDTLNLKEMLALAVLVRSPSRLDLKRGQEEIRRPMAALLDRLIRLEALSAVERETLLAESIHLRDSGLPVQAAHFVNHLYRAYPDLHKRGRLHTTLDSGLQRKAQDIIDQRLQDLRPKGVNNAAVLAVDHHSGEILAWANGGDFSSAVAGSQIDAVTTLRQPGSTLKPFVYALALEKGWTAATLIDDSPLAESVGLGLHQYRNYSRSYYGLLRLRDALGNSLNIPAVRAVQFTGPGAFLQRLRQLGIVSLAEHPDFYGDGLALGNGEISLLELTQAYAALANHGLFRPLKVLMDQDSPPGERVFSAEISSILADILADADARQLEFGRSALLRFPMQTAVKTGTSSDYRDAWAVGFNHHYTVGVWVGNLDQRPMSHVSGATGAALILRSVFAELNRNEESQPLYLSPSLRRVLICRDTGLPAHESCASRPEWFVAGTEPNAATPPAQAEAPPDTRLQRPAPGLQLAMDPRIPDASEAFALGLPDTLHPHRAEWLVDDAVICQTGENVRQCLWPLSRGVHIARARVWLADNTDAQETPPVEFEVK